MRFYDWLSVASVGNNYNTLTVSLSGVSRSILVGLLHSAADRRYWLAGNEDISDADFDDVEAALSNATLEINTEVATPSMNIEIAGFEHQVASGSGGGNTTANTLMTRPLNASLLVPGWCTRDGNVITLDAGDYFLQSIQSCYLTGHTRGAFYIDFGMFNTTAYGGWVYARANDYQHELQVCHNYILGAPSVTEVTLKMYSQLAATNGMGASQSVGAGSYASLYITRLAY